jgi:hypothetical protein
LPEEDLAICSFGVSLVKNEIGRIVMPGMIYICTDALFVGLIAEAFSNSG